MRFIRTTEEGAAEINLTPVLDCFTVLIAYLLLGGVVAAYSVLDTQLARAPASARTGEAAASGTPGAIELFFAADGTIFFRGELESRFAPVRRAIGSEAPDRPVDLALREAAKRLPPNTEVVVSGAPALPYGTFARHVGLVRKHFGAVSLRAP